MDPSNKNLFAEKFGKLESTKNNVSSELESIKNNISSELESIKNNISSELESIKNNVSIDCDETKCVVSWIDYKSDPVFNIRESRTYSRCNEPEKYKMLAVAVL
ncbi:putative ORFan [Tupanvirus deep ocean]|uniref:ORFan n=2 Tax=Tupanvirus TaxID=2094720 RepID=A0AC62A9I6_9VIRU|nr:putative ORFan [Tupanvirus deep ocean]QKU34435.1 putative ORFan [Tupanvirus deep ocean]